MAHNSDKLTVIREFGSAFNAHLAQNLLENEGIPCQLLGSDWDGPYGVPLPGNGMGIRLMVFERDASMAADLLKSVPED